MSNVDALIAQFGGSKGLARNNRYKVMFDRGNKAHLNLMCDSVLWPGRQYLSQEYFTDMKGIKKPYAFANDDLTMTFILGNDWYAWDYLERWQSSIIQNVNSNLLTYRVALKEEYTRQITVQHLDVNDEVTKTATYFNAYPTTLASIELGNEAENSVVKCTATFAYDNWMAE